MIKNANTGDPYAYQSIIEYYVEKEDYQKASDWFIDGYKKGLGAYLLEYKRQESVMGWGNFFKIPIIPDFLVKTADSGDSNYELIMYALCFEKYITLKQMQNEYWDEAFTFVGDYLNDDDIEQIVNGNKTIIDYSYYYAEKRSSMIVAEPVLKEAHKWLEKAAKHGDPNAEFLYATIIDDSVIKYEMLKKSAASGNSYALLFLSEDYYSGQNVIKSLDYCVKYCSKSAMLGNNNAKMNLAYAYHKGIGVEKSIDEARKLFHEVNTNKYKTSGKESKTIIDKLSLFCFNKVKNDSHGLSLFRYLTRFFNDIDCKQFPPLMEMYDNAVGFNDLDDMDLTHLYWPYPLDYYIYDISEYTMSGKLIFTNNQPVVTSKYELYDYLWNFFLNNASNEQLIDFYLAHKGDEEVEKYGFMFGKEMIDCLNKASDNGSSNASLLLSDLYYDKEMFETVGYSVCMANGHPVMKEMADYVCPAVSENGLYKAFETLGLI